MWYNVHTLSANQVQHIYRQTCDNFYSRLILIILFTLFKYLFKYLLKAIRYGHTQSHNNTRNSSGDEIANVNFLYEDIVHALQNTIDSCINSATDRRRYVLERTFTKFSEITQCNSHYAVRGHSRSLILVLIESSHTTSY